MTKYVKLLCSALLGLSPAAGFCIEQNDLPGFYILEPTILEPTTCPDLQAAKLTIDTDGRYQFDTYIEGERSVCRGYYNFTGEVFYGSLECPVLIMDSIKKIVVRQIIYFSDLTSGSQINIKSDLYKCAKDYIASFSITKKARIRVQPTHPSN